MVKGAYIVVFLSFVFVFQGNKGREGWATSRLTLLFGSAAACLLEVPFKSFFFFFSFFFKFLVLALKGQLPCRRRRQQDDG